MGEDWLRCKEKGWTLLPTLLSLTGFYVWYRLGNGLPHM